MRRFASVLAALLVQGCGFPPFGVCTDELRHGIKVEVVDSVTGELLGSEPAGMLTDGPYRETMEPAGPGLLWGAPERPGTYDVEITAEGYQPWNRNGVVVEMEWDGCHVETVELQASMFSTASPLE